MTTSNNTVKVFLALACTQLLHFQLVSATASYDLLVLDADTMKPIKGVDVVGWFSNSNGWKAWTESAPEYEDRKTTNEKGLCHLAGETNNGKTGVNIHKPPQGYYPNSFSIRYTFTQKPILPLMHWRPTDIVVTASLCKVEHPIPLFVKRVFLLPGQTAIAENGGKFAYDLVKGDCLPPFGKGEVADVEFTMMPQESIGEGKNVFHRKERYRNTVKMTFLGDDANGLMALRPKEDLYLKIRTAPTDGYVKDFKFSEWYAYNLEQKEGWDENRCFAFRIRARRNDKGEIESALHGKIYRDVRLRYCGDDYASDRWSRKVDGISFFYYLNPTSNDRNLEWDRKNNLCDKPGKLEISVNHTPMLLP